MRLKVKFLLACAGGVIFASQVFAAQGGAVAATNAKSQASAQAAANLGAGGPGPDLRAISSPKQPQTLTGFPAGTLPGDNVGSGGTNAAGIEGRVVFSGDPLAPLMGPELMGRSLDHVYIVAAHLGYTLERRSYTSNVLDGAYVFDAMSGRSRKARLYFNRSMQVLSVDN